MLRWWWILWNLSSLRLCHLSKISLHPPFLPNLDSHDLASSIISSQIHKKSETINWSDESMTYYHALWGTGLTYAKKTPTQCLSLCPFWNRFLRCLRILCTYNTRTGCTTSQQLCEEISAAICMNKAVVIRKISTPKPVMLDLDYLEDHGMSDLMHIVIYGKSILCIDHMI